MSTPPVSETPPRTKRDVKIELEQEQEAPQSAIPMARSSGRSSVEPNDTELKDVDDLDAFESSDNTVSPGKREAYVPLPGEIGVNSHHDQSAPAENNVGDGTQAAKRKKVVKIGTQFDLKQASKQKLPRIRLQPSKKDLNDHKASTSIQRAFRGYIIRQQRFRTARVDDFIATMRMERETEKGYRNLFLYIAFLVIFAWMLIAQRRLQSTYPFVKGVEDYLNKLEFPERGNVCPALVTLFAQQGLAFCRDPLLTSVDNHRPNGTFMDPNTIPTTQVGVEGNSKYHAWIAGQISDAGLRGNDPVRLTNAELRKVCGNVHVDLKRHITLKDISTVDHIHSFIEELSLHVNDYDSHGILGMREAMGRLNALNRVYAGMIIIMKQNEMEECASSSLKDLYPKCRSSRRKTSSHINLPPGVQWNESLVAPAFKGIGVCPPLEYDSTFDGHVSFIPNTYTFVGSDSYAQYIVPAWLRYFNLFDYTTEEISVMLAIVNPEVRQAASIQVRFRLDEHGGIEHRVIINSITTWTEGDFAGVEFVLFWIFVTGVVMNFSGKLNQIRVHHLRGTLYNYFWSAKNFVDLANYILYIYSIVGFIVHVSAISTFDINSFAGAANDASINTLEPIVRAILSTVSFVEEQSTSMTNYYSLQALSLFLSLIRLFNFVSFQPRLSMIGKTLSDSGSDIFHFLAIYTEVMILFSCAGNIVFGSVLDNFSDLWLSLSTLLSWNLGNFETGILFIEYPSIGPAFFIVFLIFVYLVLLQIFIAVIVSRWRDTKRESSTVSDPVNVQVRKLFTRWLIEMMEMGKAPENRTVMSSIDKLGILFKLRDKLNASKDYTLLYLQSQLKLLGMPKGETETLCRLFLRRKFRRAPAVDNRALRGIVTRLEVLQEKALSSAPHGSIMDEISLQRNLRNAMMDDDGSNAPVSMDADDGTAQQGGREGDMIGQA